MVKAAEFRRNDKLLAIPLFEHLLAHKVQIGVCQIADSCTAFKGAAVPLIRALNEKAVENAIEKAVEEAVEDEEDDEKEHDIEDGKVMEDIL